MSLKVKRVSPDAVMPIATSVGYELTAIALVETLANDGTRVFDTGLQIQTPAGYVAEVFPLTPYDGSVAIVDRGNLFVTLKSGAADNVELPRRVAKLIARKVEDFPGGVEETNALPNPPGESGPDPPTSRRRLII